MQLAVRRFSALSGLVFLLLGVIGFISPHLFGLFHLHGLHNAIHLVFGILGLLAAGNAGYARRYAQALGIVFLAMAVIGVFTRSILGIMPAGLSDHVLHFIAGAVGTYFGFVLTSDEEARPVRRRAL